MVYRPPVKKSAFDGPSGQAKVILNKTKTMAKVVFNEGGDEYTMNIKECPPDVKGYIRSGEFYVKLDTDKEKILSMSPSNGMFEVKVLKFSAQKDQPPKPLTKPGQDWSYLFFVVLLEIVSGECKGMQIPLFLRYNFCEEEQEVKGKVRSVVGYSKNLEKSRHTAFLDEFLSVAGAWDAGAIPFSDNVLPKLEERILRADKKFNVLIKKGFVDNLYQGSSMPDEASFDETEPEENEKADFDGDELADDPENFEG